MEKSLPCSRSCGEWRPSLEAACGRQATEWEAGLAEAARRMQANLGLSGWNSR